MAWIDKIVNNLSGAYPINVKKVNGNIVQVVFDKNDNKKEDPGERLTSKDGVSPVSNEQVLDFFYQNYSGCSDEIEYVLQYMKEDLLGNDEVGQKYYRLMRDKRDACVNDGDIRSAKIKEEEKIKEEQMAKENEHILIIFDELQAAKASSDLKKINALYQEFCRDAKLDPVMFPIELFQAVTKMTGAYSNVIHLEFAHGAALKYKNNITIHIQDMLISYDDISYGLGKDQVLLAADGKRHAFKKEELNAEGNLEGSEVRLDKSGRVITGTVFKEKMTIQGKPYVVHFEAKFKNGRMMYELINFNKPVFLRTDRGTSLFFTAAELDANGNVSGGILSKNTLHLYKASVIVDYGYYNGKNDRSGIQFSGLFFKDGAELYAKDNKKYKFSHHISDWYSTSIDGSGRVVRGRVIRSYMNICGRSVLVEDCYCEYFQGVARPNYIRLSKNARLRASDNKEYTFKAISPDNITDDLLEVDSDGNIQKGIIADDVLDIQGKKVTIRSCKYEYDFLNNKPVFSMMQLKDDQKLRTVDGREFTFKDDSYIDFDGQGLVSSGYFRDQEIDFSGKKVVVNSGSYKYENGKGVLYDLYFDVPAKLPAADGNEYYFSRAYKIDATGKVVEGIIVNDTVRTSIWKSEEVEECHFQYSEGKAHFKVYRKKKN